MLSFVVAEDEEELGNIQRVLGANLAVNSVDEFKFNSVATERHEVVLAFTGRRARMKSETLAIKNPQVCRWCVVSFEYCIEYLLFES